MRVGVAAEIRKADKLRVGRILRHFNQIVGFPELCKRRQRHLLAGAALPGDVVEGFQPLKLAFPFGEARMARPFPQRSLSSANTSKSLRASITRRHNLLHRHQMLVAVVAGHG
ncbi:Uncharacterised protein [Citrobacter koseri]|uniref:Uncharacterized protein n=1 Tax=Citrobacter koseri TaxID=545 RepID=A0A2X2WJ47_CITKO|nr:Uncharacterised protein [Citrobacter koseri]